MSKNMLRFGGSGLGELGVASLEQFDKEENVTVVSGFDPVHEARSGFEETLPGATAYDTFDEMLGQDDIDAVCLLGPHSVHYEKAKTVLESPESGISGLYIEKPMVTDAGHAVDLYERASETDIEVQVGLQRHLDEAYQEIRTAATSGRIGTVESVTGRLWQPGWAEEHEDTWRRNPTLSGGGELYDSGQHLLDAILFGLDAVPTQVEDATMEYLEPGVDKTCEFSAELQQRGSRNTVSADIGVYGVPTAEDVEDPNVPDEYLHAGRPDDQMSPDEYLHIEGTNGEITFDGYELTISNGGEDQFTYETGDTGKEAISPEKARAFIDGMNDYNRTNDHDTEVATVEDGMWLTLFTEAAYEAADTNQTVTVADLVPENNTYSSTPVAYADD